MLRIIIQILLALSLLTQKAYPLNIPVDMEIKKFLSDVSSSKIENIDTAILKLDSLRGRLTEIEDYLLYFIIKLYLKKGDIQGAYRYLDQFNNTHQKSILKGKVNLALAKSLYKNGKPEDAYRFIKIAMESWLGRSKPEALLIEGFILESMGNIKEALKSYYRLREAFPLSPEDRIARQRTGLIRRTTNITLYPSLEEYLFAEGSLLIKERQYDEAAKNLDRLIEEFPESSLVREGKFKRAELFMLMGEPKKALDKFIRIKNAYPGERIAAESLIKAIGILWKEDSISDVRSLALELYNNYPYVPWSDRAVYILGRLFEEEGKWDEAVSLYKKALEQFKKSPLRENFMKRMAWCYYLKGDFSHSSEIFNQLSNKFSSLKEYGLYWKAKSFERMGKKEEAWEIFNSLANLPYTSYYGVLSLKKIGKLSPCNEGRVRETQDNKGDGAFNNVGLLRAMILSELSLLSEAQEELDLLSKADLDLSEKFQLSRLYKKAGSPYKSIKIASSIERELKSRNELASPLLELDILLFPLEYKDEILKYSLENGFDPLLIASIIRQESAFDPAAISRSNAMGLMQIIPQTGAMIAKKTGISSFTPDMLYQPSINIELGISYLKMLNKKFKGNTIKTLAAYNAGETLVEKWWKRISHMEDDEIVENIPYNETENYIKNIIRNHYHYIRIYCGSSLMPNLSP